MLILPEHVLAGHLANNLKNSFYIRRLRIGHNVIVLSDFRFRRWITCVQVLYIADINRTWCNIHIRIALDLMAIFFVNLFSCVVIHFNFLVLPVMWAFPVTKIRFFSLSCYKLEAFLGIISCFYTKSRKNRAKKIATSAQEVTVLTGCKHRNII